MPWLLCLFLAVLTLSAAVPTQVMVDVGDNVRIEVLDWGGGAGKPVLLLTGSGLTAHIYDDFAPRLLAKVPGIRLYTLTRRGYGASSKPDRGYSVPELSEDIWRVIESLHLEKPVLVGHSMAGSELSYLGQKHSPQLGGLVYLDAIADPMDFPWSNAEYRDLTMKSVQRDKEAGKPGGPPPRPTAADRASVDAYIAYQQGTMGWSFPAAEIRDLYEIKDGTVGAYAVPQRVGRAIDAGSIGKDYRGITTRVLALVNVQKPPAPDANPDSKRLYELEMDFIRRWESNLKRAVPTAEIEEWPGADHYLFIRQQDRVIEALRKFLGAP